MVKVLMRALLTGFFLLLTLTLYLLGTYAPALIFSFYPALSRNILRALAGFFSLFPIAMWELLALLLIFWALYSMIRSFAQLKFLKWITGLTMTLSIGLFAFVAIWGLNYFAPPMHERLELSGEQYTVQQLKEATIYYRDMANKTAPSVARDASGAMLPVDFDALAQQAGDGYKTLAETMDCFNGSTAAPKQLLSSKLMGATGTTGIFIAFTGESCVCSTTYTASIPFTMCHEIGHRMAFAREDEANFAGFLACSVHESPAFRYSGYYRAFSYCYNALYQVDKTAATEVWKGVGRELAADCNAAAEHYKLVENETASAVTDKVYDTYLKVFEVESGIQSYGEVADLLLMWYFERIK